MTNPLTDDEYEPIRTALFDRRNGSASEAKQAIADALATAGYVLIRDQPDHYVTFDEAGWFVEHSVACRVAGTLGTCAYGNAVRMVAVEPDPRQLGRWRITEIDEMGLPSLERADGRPT